MQPALLPADLPFNSIDTTVPNAEISQTEIRAYVTSSPSTRDNITFTREFYTGTEYTLPEGTDIVRTDYGAKMVMNNYKNTTGVYTCGLESRFGIFSTSVVLHTRDGKCRLEC